jgi:large subunit ribosomal protein L25
MAENPTLEAERRAVTGKAVRHLRRDGITPVVVYGAHTAPVALQVNTKDLLHTLHQAGGTRLIAIAVQGETKSRMVLAREVQRHVTRFTPLHVDFLEVDVHELVTSAVPIVVDGEPDLVNRGQAILHLLVSQVTVEALPTEIPPAIHVDSTRLVEFDDTVRISDLDTGPRVRILDNPDELVIHLSALRAVEVEEVEVEEPVVTTRAEAESPRGED